MYFFELSAFWHLFGYFISNAIHFLVVNRKSLLILKNSILMIEEFDGSFLIRVSVSYRKGMLVMQCVEMHRNPCEFKNTLQKMKITKF